MPGCLCQPEKLPGGYLSSKVVTSTSPLVLSCVPSFFALVGPSRVPVVTGSPVVAPAGVLNGAGSDSNCGGPDGGVASAAVPMALVAANAITAPTATFILIFI